MHTLAMPACLAAVAYTTPNLLQSTGLVKILELISHTIGCDAGTLSKGNSSISNPLAVSLSMKKKKSALGLTFHVYSRIDLNPMSSVFSTMLTEQNFETSVTTALDQTPVTKTLAFLC